MAEKKPVAKFSKEQLLNAKQPIGNVDVLYAILDEEKQYTKEEAIKLYESFLKSEV